MLMIPSYAFCIAIKGRVLNDADTDKRMVNEVENR